MLTTIAKSIVPHVDSLRYAPQIPRELTTSLEAVARTVSWVFPVDNVDLH